MNIKQAFFGGWQKLKKVKIDSAIADAEILLLGALDKKDGKAWLAAHPEYRLKPNQEKNYKNLIRRRMKKEPIAYILKRKEFFGLDFYVDKSVLIPRPETEILVEAAISAVREKKLNPQKIILADIGTGSGCIPVSLAKSMNFKKIYAADVSKKALRVARFNAKKNKAAKKIIFINGDLFAPFIAAPALINSERLIITANLPYVKSNEFKKLPIGVKKYEPALALDGGRSGLRLITKLLNEIELFRQKTQNLNMLLFLETDPRQKYAIIKETKRCFKDAKFSFLKDLRGKNRIIKVAIKPYF